jgi:L-rhamnose mutarotase
MRRDGMMVRMAADPATQRWWDACKPLLDPLETRGPDEFWAAMEEVFHAD